MRNTDSITQECHGGRGGKEHVQGAAIFSASERALLSLHTIIVPSKDLAT